MKAKHMEKLPIDDPKLQLLQLWYPFPPEYYHPKI